MYKPSSNMPLNSFQVVNPCENQTNFRAGQIIRFIIPRSIGFWDPHTSRLQLEVGTLLNNYKMCFSHDCGVASLIDMIRISQNGVVLSETTEYATLNNLFTLYSDSLSIKQRNSTQNGARDLCVPVVGDGTVWPPAGLLPRTSSSGAVLGEPLNGASTASNNMDRTPKKYQLELRGIGLFELLSVVPSIALGDILIEIRLVNNNKDGIKIHPATGIPQVLSTAFASGVDTCKLSPPFLGFTNLSDSPYAIGMQVTPVDANGGTPATALTITGMTQDRDNGEITLTFNGNAGAANPNILISTGNEGTVNSLAGSAFQVSRASMLLQVVRPPQQYIESVAAKVQEGLMLDLNTYTTYRATIQQNIKTVTVDIPAMMSRAKAIFSVPRPQTQGEFLPAGETPDNLNGSNILGQYDGLLRYRTQIGELYYPNQPVQLDQFVKDRQCHFSAQHIVELEKALNASRIPLRSLESCKQNFVIPRVLAKYGATVSLDKGVRLYLEYNGNGATAPLDVVTFVNHINRLMITPAGIEVLS